MDPATYGAPRRVPGLICSILLLSASVSACASGTIGDEAFELSDAGESATAASGDSSLGILTSDASTGGPHASAGSASGAGDAAAARAPVVDASAATTTRPPPSATTTPAVIPTTPATKPAGDSGGTASPAKLDAGTTPDATTSPAGPASGDRPATTNPTTKPANTPECKTDDDCAEVSCLPIGVIGCCRIDGVCGCTWSAAYCL